MPKGLVGFPPTMETLITLKTQNSLLLWIQQWGSLGVYVFQNLQGEGPLVDIVDFQHQDNHQI